jgi:hypothetical protein
MPNSSKFSDFGPIAYAASAMQTCSCYRYAHAQHFERNPRYNRLPIVAGYGPIFVFEHPISTLAKDFLCGQ